MKAFALFIALAVTGCSRPEPIPADLLPREKFTGVLLEAQLIEARLQMGSDLDTSKDVAADRFYDDMFREQGVTRDVFNNTFNWYTKHPEKMKEVYTDILARMQQRADSTAH